MRQLDEISRVIGGLEQSSANLLGTLEKHVADDDRRHEQNLTAIEGLGRNLETLTRVVEPLAKAIGVLQPAVEGLQITRWKAAGALSLVFCVVYFLGWLVSAFAIKGTSWLLALFMRP